MYPCIILCGGLAMRLGPIAAETPKCLLEVNNKPFLYYQLKYLEKSGAKDVYLSVDHLSEKFYSFIKNYRFKNISIKLVEDGPSPLGTGGAVKNIIKRIDSPSFVMYGDSFLRVNFLDVCNSYNENLGPLIVIYKNDDRYDKSNVHFDGDNIIYNKTKPSHLSDYIDYGIGIYKYSHFENTIKSFDLSLIQEKFSKFKKLQYFEAKKRFYEIGTPESYKKSEEFFIKYEDK
jgi:NDP-sugar pyrophosphorylase family protein